MPITVAEANGYVAHFHRHNGGLPTARLAVAAIDTDGVVHGVAIAGAPKARMAAKRDVLEVSRVCTDGTFNCCSFLYSRLARAAKALGYQRVLTYTLASEPGTSLKASGWTREQDLKARGDGWANRLGSQAGQLQHDTGAKVRWSITFAPAAPEVVWPDGVFDLPAAQLDLLGDIA